MSNEWKDYVRDKVEEAEVWISMYPFLRIKDNSIYPWLNTEKIEECWVIHDLPNGWVVSFAKQMCDELLEALGKYVDRWIIMQVKEKFGELRIYYRWEKEDLNDEEINELKRLSTIIDRIINKYEILSYKTCAICGESADVRNIHGWILPYCMDCYKEKYDHD